MILKNLTVVMSVYNGDIPELFKGAIESVLDQTQKANKIIIAVDGPISEGLNCVLKDLSSVSCIDVIRIASNKGLAASRKLAISLAKTELIAVMDSDDFSVNNRFELQASILSDPRIDVVGGWIREFKKIPGDQNLIRKTPINHSDIYKFGKYRNPMNHVTLMFKKSSYDFVGGYTELLAAEDWDLISRMLVNGLVIRNIPEILVNVRGGDDMVKRRRSSRHFWGEIKVLSLMYKCNYLNFFQLFTNVGLRTIIRILPLSFTAFLYCKILRKKFD